MSTPRFHTLRIAEVIRDTRDAVLVRFEVPPELCDTFRYKAGQHLTMRARLGEEDIRRSYSICASEAEQQLRIGIKRTPEGLFSNWAHDSLEAGNALECMPPAGHFGVPAQSTTARHHVAFAVGSGITPIFAIIKTILETEPSSRVTLFYGNRASSSVMLREELENLKDRYTTRLTLAFVLSREQQDIDLFNGRIDGVKCNALLDQWLNTDDIDQAYICGPQSMMSEVSASLMQHGVAKTDIHMELFDTGLQKRRPPRTKKTAAGTPSCEVSVTVDGQTRVFELEKNGPTVLDAALSQGIELPYSCKGGVCSTCRCKLVEGEVDMDSNFALEDYEVERGYILACQSFPVSDKLVLDYDQRDS